MFDSYELTRFGNNYLIIWSASLKNELYHHFKGIFTYCGTC